MRAIEIPDRPGRPGWSPGYNTLKDIDHAIRDDFVHNRVPTAIRLGVPADVAAPTHIWGLPVEASGVLPEGQWRLVYGKQPEKSILDEAKAIVEGKAREKYGSPAENCEKIAGMWSQYLMQKYGFNDLQTEDVAMMMVLLKVVRQSNTFGRDNLTDIAGWAAVAYEASEDR